MEDFHGLTALEETGERKIVGVPKEFQDFTDMFAVDYNSTMVNWTSENFQAMGCPGGLTLVLSLLA